MINIEIFRAAVEEEINNLWENNKDTRLEDCIRLLAKRVIALTADAMVGDDLPEYHKLVGYRLRIEEELQLAEELKNCLK